MKFTPVTIYPLIKIGLQESLNNPFLAENLKVSQIAILEAFKKLFSNSTKIINLEFFGKRNYLRLWINNNDKDFFFCGPLTSSETRYVCTFFIYAYTVLKSVIASLKLGFRTSVKT